MKVIKYLVAFSLGGLIALAASNQLKNHDTLIQQLREDVEQMEGLCK